MRVCSLWLLAVVAGCGTSGLGENPPASNELNLFPSGSEEELLAAEELAYAHLEQSRRLGDVGDLWTEAVEIDGLSTAHVKISQTVDGTPVTGGETIVHLKPNGTVSYVSDSLVREIDLTQMEPAYTAEEATDVAAELMGGWEVITNTPVGSLTVVRFEEEDHLAWRVPMERMDGTDRSEMPVHFIDANTLKPLFSVDEMQSVGTADTAYNGPIEFEAEVRSGRHELRGTGFGSRYATYSYQNAVREAGTSFSRTQMAEITSADGVFTDEAAADAHWAVEQTFDFLDTVHDWQGYNGNGGPRYKDSTMTVVVHYGTNYNNAFWNGQQITFGDGDGTRRGHYASLDVVAHEIGHAVTRNSANLVYRNESGALNEAFADILGARVEAWVDGEINGDVWKIGEDLVTPNGSTTDAMRHMNNPTLAGSSRDHYSTRYQGDADKGGVHWNSGIANLAYYLTVEGGSHPKASKSVTTVEGIGMEKAGAIYWRALHSYMTANTNFAGARTATLQAAADLYGQGSAEYAAVGNGWAEVGVGLPIAAPGGPIDLPSPAPAPGEGNAVDLSAGAGEWIHYTVEVPAGATGLDVQIQGDSGDADLYVRHGREATEQAYDCRPYQAGSNETCTFADPASGTWHISLRGWSAFTGVQLITTVEGGATPFLDESDIAGAQGSETAFTLTVPAGAHDLEFSMAGGTGDADLYVRQGSSPTLTEFDCRPYRAGNVETCSIPAPVAGEYHVMVRGYQAYSGVSLTGRWDD